MEKDKLNPNRVRKYIESALFGIAKHNNERDKYNIGVELEVFPLINNSKNKIESVNLYKGKNALFIPLKKVSEKYGGTVTSKNPKVDKHKNALEIDTIQFPNQSSLFFEPGGQVEISTKPCQSLKGLENQLQFIQNILKEVSSETGISFIQSGINNVNINQLTNQLQKPRYIALEEYLNAIGPFGRQMMLKTCSMHINMEMGMDKTTKLKRIIATNLLVPFTTAIFANSPSVDNNLKPLKAYRSHIWQNLDATRTGILPLTKALKSMSLDDLIDAYYNFVINAPLIYIQDFGRKVFSKKITLGYWMSHQIKGIWPNESHLRNHLSLLFPEVRIKGYLEIRSIDSPPLKWQMIPLCFYSGLLYSPSHLDKVINLLKPLYINYNKIHKQACYGLESEEIYQVSKQLMKIAIEGFSTLPNHFKNEKYTNDLQLFNAQYLDKRKTFADN